MSADSAAWYIETAINLTYSNGVPNTALKSSGSYRVISGGDLSMSEVAESYDMVLRDISNTYYSENNQEFSFVDVSLTADTLSWYHYYPDIDQTVDDTFKPIPPPDGFSERNKDYWYAIGGAGKWKGDDAGYYKDQGRDATTELTTRYNYWKVTKRSSSYVWVDVDNHYADENTAPYGVPLFDMLWTNPNSWYGYISAELNPDYLQNCYSYIIPEKIDKILRHYGDGYYCFWITVHEHTPSSRYHTFSKSSMGSTYWEHHCLDFKIGRPVLRSSSGTTMPRL